MRGLVYEIEIFLLLSWELWRKNCRKSYYASTFFSANRNAVYVQAIITEKKEFTIKIGKLSDINLVKFIIFGVRLPLLASFWTLTQKCFWFDKSDFQWHPRKR